MKGLAAFRCAAVFLAAALLVSGADTVSTAVPPPVSADTERCVHLAVPPPAGKDFIKVSMSFNASPSNSLSVAFGADADGDGRLSLREQAAALGWDNGAWFVRRPGASAWERLEEAGAAGPRLLEAVLWLRSATAGPRLALSVDGTPAACGALRYLLAGGRRFRDWARSTPLPVVLAVLLAFAEAVRVGGSKPEPSPPPAQGLISTLLVQGVPPAPSASSAQGQASPPPAQGQASAPPAWGRLPASATRGVPPACLMPPPADGFVPPPRYTNRLTQAQYDACFALTHAATNAAHDFAPPAGAAVTDYVSGHGVHDDAWWVPLVAGFNAGGLEDRSRFAAAVCAAPSGMLLLDGPPGRLAPAAPAFPDPASNRVLSVLQTPSGLLPPEGRLWSAAGTGGLHTVTWNSLMLGRIEEAKADLQCRLHPDGDFEYFIRPRPGADLSAVTNWLIGAADAGGGEAFAFADGAPLSAALPPGGAALALRWTAFGRLDPAVPDTDGDGLTDWEELMVHRTGPRRWDTDRDGLGDGDEVLKYGTDPLSPDSLGDGTNDFWRVVDAAQLASAPPPWMEGGAGLALLTLEARLEAPAGLAALRVGDAVVPVRPGAAEVSRVAVPRGADVPFALVPGPGTSADDAAVTALESSPPIVARDGDGVFRTPALAGAASHASQASAVPRFSARRTLSSDTTLDIPNASAPTRSSRSALMCA